ncbi:MAG: M13 family metallopeptidase [Acidobacteria bacterium]|nr:M13 family metallopeptidase [Acidobacteriota bacterium]
MPRFASVALVGVMTIAAIACGEVREPEEFVTNSHGLDRRNMDETVEACDDFYQYANGTWLATNTIPAEHSSWGISSEMRERNYELLRDILEESALADVAGGSNRQKVGDFWSTGIDTQSIEAAGLAPIEADLARIDAIASRDDVTAIVRDLHLEGTTVLFEMAIFQDLKDSEQYIAYAIQGGLGLPDRDYYTREDEESSELREKYSAHVSRMLQLLGGSPEAADSAAAEILALETRFAEASLTNVELRNPANYYNIQAMGDADAATPAFSWTTYFDHLGLDALETFSYAHPKFFTVMNEALEETSLGTWKSYLRWHLINSFSPYLSEAVVNADFEFYGKTLRGTEELRPRWKRVVDQTSASLGEALGRVYVEDAFPPETKARADEMIENLRDAVRMRLQNLEWMGEKTKTRAIEKLESFVSKIGYPNEWRDYSRLEVGAESYLANARAGNAFEMWRNLDKIGKPIDRNEWGMAPQTINAYYNPVMNEIVFPAAIMQPPFFDGEMDDAVNYGAMGGVIGHEFMHGFDDQGSRFDAAGNMQNWWTDEDRARFEERTAKLVDQYSGFVAVEDLHVNGELTLGENIGDLAGITMAYYALQEALKENDPGEIDGFTPNQRFFLSWAQARRRNYRDEAMKLQVNTNPHSPSKFRANGPMTNMPEFAAAWRCVEGDAMVQAADLRADIW